MHDHLAEPPVRLPEHASCLQEAGRFSTCAPYISLADASPHDLEAAIRGAVPRLEAKRMPPTSSCHLLTLAACRRRVLLTGGRAREYTCARKEQII